MIDFFQAIKEEQEKHTAGASTPW